MSRLLNIAITVALVIVGISTNSFGQQVYQFGQYQQNLYILNSASAGVHDYLDVNMSYRQQWVGIENSPTTYYVSANMPIGQRLGVHPKESSTRISTPQSYNSIKRTSFHAVGLFAAQDAYGPFICPLRMNLQLVSRQMFRSIQFRLTQIKLL